jgi:hypothetical protein
LSLFRNSGSRVYAVRFAFAALAFAPNDTFRLEPFVCIAHIWSLAFLTHTPVCYTPSTLRLLRSHATERVSVLLWIFCRYVSAWRMWMCVRCSSELADMLIMAVPPTSAFITRHHQKDSDTYE